MNSKPIRFALDKATHASLTANPLLPPATARRQRVLDGFFDTNDFALARQSITLRVRKAGRRLVLTLLHGETVMEATLSGPTPDLTVFGHTWQTTLEAATLGLPLKLIANASLTQDKRRFEAADLVFETGFLNSSTKKQAVYEVEVTASTSLLPSIARLFASQFNLNQQPEPLAVRAARLAGGPAPEVHKAAPGLKGDPCLDDAMAWIIQTCLTQFRANWPVFHEGDEVGAVHQMRVAMRRLRSALGLFNRALPTPAFLELRQEAKRIASIMGEARNWDVFIATLQAGPMQAFPDEVGFAALEAQCKAHRQAGYRQVEALLKHPDTTRFLLTAEAFLARRGWRENLPAELLPHLAEPAQIMAVQALSRLHRKIRRHGKKLTHLSVNELHMIRIELKKLRYATDFFGSLFKNEARVRQFSRAAAHLQEELGGLNDLATAKGLALRLHTDTVETGRALGIILGWTAHAARGAPKTLTASWKQFLDIKRLT